MGQSIRCGYSGGGCCNNSHAMEIWKRIPAIIMLVAIAYISNTNSYGANICGVHCSYRSQLIARTMTRRECAPPNQNERKKKWKIETSNKNARTKCNARYTKRSLRDFSLAMRLTWNRFFFFQFYFIIIRMARQTTGGAKPNKKKHRRNKCNRYRFGRQLLRRLWLSLSSRIYVTSGQRRDRFKDKSLLLHP